jgi:CO/xanthine dehydrogenase FAD-binding subunit
MKPPRFRYFDPETVEEAVALLGEHGYDAKVLAGGQSLVPLLNFRLARPAVLVDLNRIRDLDYIREQNGSVAIGAMARQSRLEQDRAIDAKCGVLREAVTFIGHPQIRNRGTVGGSIAHADPAAELPAIALALDAELTVAGTGGRRTIPASDFFVGLMTTALEPTEMLTEVRLPALPPGSGWALEEFALRHGDFALAGAVAVVTLDEQGRCATARLAAIGMGEVPFRDRDAEALLQGQTVTDKLLDEVAGQISRKVDPASDMHASAQQRRSMVGVLSRKAVKRAAERARPATEKGRR